MACKALQISNLQAASTSHVNLKINTMITIAMAFDCGIFKGARATILSIILSNPGKKISFKILDGGIHPDQKYDIENIISRHKNCLLDWIPFDVSRVNSYVSHQEFTHMTYARILIPELVSSEYCIYIDADFLFFSDLDDIWSEDPDTLMAAVPDGPGSSAGAYPWHDGLIEDTFVNTGLLWMNLNEWRKLNIHGQILNFLSENSAYCKWADQNAINWILRGRIKLLENRFNAMSIDIDSGLMEFVPGMTNIHFASGLKPWKRPIPTITHSIWRYFNSKFPSSTDTRVAWGIENILRYVSKNFTEHESSILFSFEKQKKLNEFKKYLAATID